MRSRALWHSRRPGADDRGKPADKGRLAGHVQTAALIQQLFQAHPKRNVQLWPLQAPFGLTAALQARVGSREHARVRLGGGREPPEQFDD